MEVVVPLPVLHSPIKQKGQADPASGRIVSGSTNKATPPSVEEWRSVGIVERSSREHEDIEEEEDTDPHSGRAERVECEAGYTSDCRG